MILFPGAFRTVFTAISQLIRLNLVLTGHLISVNLCLLFQLKKLDQITIGIFDQKIPKPG
jgi:hypothetical protein